MNKINDPASRMQDYLVFGENGGVNPSIPDSATFTFLATETMEGVFAGEIEGCYLYSRHTTPIGNELSHVLALMENTPAAHVMGSGMGAITSVLLQLCSAGDEVISSRTIYGGTYAFLKNFAPKFNINTKFVDITNLEIVEKNINKNTKVIYCETISNPLLEIADLSALRKLADKYNLKLVVDNTFCPLVITPYDLGAHIVVYSMTKFINGTNDTTAGSVCADLEFINSLKSVSDGAAMLLGPVLDTIRAASILKNIHTLHIRMRQHSSNAMYIAQKLENIGIRTIYPGLESHPQHNLIKSMINDDYGYSGIITIDTKEKSIADKFMIAMQTNKVGYFAVSLGYFKTLFSSPGSSTSSEIPPEEQIKMGMSNGLVRLSVGLDNDIERSYQLIIKSAKEAGLIK